MQRGSYVVGVAGGSGSGKTSLVRSLCSELPQGLVTVVSQDDYYHPREEQSLDRNGKVNFDLPTAVDLDGLAGDLELLVGGRSIYRKEYTFNQDDKVAGLLELHPAPIILVEGLFILHHRRVSRMFDLRVFVEAGLPILLERRLRRDAAERGYGREEVMYQWDNHVLPAYHEYLLPYRQECDLHVMNGSSFERASRVLSDHLLSKAGQLEPVLSQSL